MAYKALYRTYRPTNFDEVAGQQHIVKTHDDIVQPPSVISGHRSNQGAEYSSNQHGADSHKERAAASIHDTA